MIKGSIQQEDITFTKVYAPNTGAPRYTEQMFNIQKTKIMASGAITDGETVETMADFILGGSKITADDDCSHEIKRHLLLGSYDQPRQHIKKRRHYFVNKGPSSQDYGFSCGHVWM